jgi:hypothetical protein
MKKLLLILLVIFIGCSENSEPIPEEKKIEPFTINYSYYFLDGVKKYENGVLEFKRNPNFISYQGLEPMELSWYRGTNKFQYTTPKEVITVYIFEDSVKIIEKKQEKVFYKN